MSATASVSQVQGHLQCRQTQLGIDAPGNRPADNLAGIEIQNRCQIDEAGTNADVSDVGHPNLIDRTHLSFFDQIGINRQRMTGIGRSDEPAPGDGPKTELIHHTPNPFGIDRSSTTIQFTLDSAIPIARKLGMNIVDLTAKFLIFGIPFLSAPPIGLVVVTAGRKPGYFAGFRYRSKFFAVIADVSALLCC